MKKIVIVLAGALAIVLSGCTASGSASGWSSQAGGISGSGTIRER